MPPDLAPSPAPSSPSPPPAAPAAVPARPAPLAQSTPVMSEPERRYKADYDRLTAQDPYRDPNQLLRRAPDGTITAEARSPDPANPQPGDQPKPGDQQPPQQQPRTDGGKILLAEGIEVSEQELRDLVSFKASEDSRRLTAPQKAEDFKLELPADLTMPQGVTFQIDPNNPAVEPARAFALRNNLSQQQFSEMLGVYAATQANEMVAFNSAKAAEVTKLGDAANARVDAVRGG